jgi:hypothetical protein
VASVTRHQTSRDRRGRFWAILMTFVAGAALREAAFARNKTRSPLVVPESAEPAVSSDQ